MPQENVTFFTIPNITIPSPQKQNACNLHQVQVFVCSCHVASISTLRFHRETRHFGLIEVQCGTEGKLRTQITTKTWTIRRFLRPERELFPREIPGALKSGSPIPILLPYHSHKNSWYGKLMGRGSHYWRFLKKSIIIWSGMVRFGCFFFVVFLGGVVASNGLYGQHHFLGFACLTNGFQWFR